MPAQEEADKKVVVGADVFVAFSSFKLRCVSRCAASRVLTRSRVSPKSLQAAAGSSSETAQVCVCVSARCVRRKLAKRALASK